MNINKAKNYLNRINRLFPNIEEDGSSVPQIEKDLMLSYIRGLYESFLETETEVAPAPQPIKKIEKTPVIEVPKVVAPPVIVEVPRAVEVAPVQPVHQPETPPQEPPVVKEMQKVEPPKVEPPKVEPPKAEIPKATLPKIEIPKITPPQELPAIKEIPKVEPPKVEVPKVEIPRVEPQKVVEELPAVAPKVVEEIIPMSFDEYDVLFEEEKVTDLSQRLSQTKITNIRASMGINERFLVQNELFGGNTSKFNEALDTLNDFENFLQAKALIIKTLAPENNWLDEKRLKRAQSFVQKVRRKYK